MRNLNLETHNAQFKTMWFVWKALFIREILTRLFSGRLSWFWLIAEPFFHMAFMLFLFSIIRVRVIGGIDTIIWLIAGLTSYFIFSRTTKQCSNALSANESIFAFRQVRAFDPLLVRSIVEILISLIVFFLLCILAAALEHDPIPDDPLKVIAAFACAWLFAISLGMNLAALSLYSEDLQKFVSFFWSPIYLFSGVIFPITSIPEPYQEWLTYNPIANIIVCARQGFALHYKSFEDPSLLYVIECTLPLMAIGLALNRKIQYKILEK